MKIIDILILDKMRLGFWDEIDVLIGFDYEELLMFILFYRRILSREVSLKFFNELS